MHTTTDHEAHNSPLVTLKTTNIKGLAQKLGIPFNLLYFKISHWDKAIYDLLLPSSLESISQKNS